MKLSILAFLLIFASFVDRGSGCLAQEASARRSGTTGWSQLNVYGLPLQSCSTDPMTGWFRDGYCRTDRYDRGLHTVCATMTQEFLAYTKSQGNDLSTPRGYFPGLRPGDRWCLCARRWQQAYYAGKAPLVHLDATHWKAADVNTLEVLSQYSDLTSSASP